MEKALSLHPEFQNSLPKKDGLVRSEITIVQKHIYHKRI